MTSRKDLRDEVNQLKNRTSDMHSEITYYEHPETGELYNRFKESVEEPTGFVIDLSWRMAPFVVDRSKAEANEWPIVESVDCSDERDLVEVSTWCVNPWVDNPDDREIISK